jgi:ABC-type glycerol-3-phosphate transport system substrate-binding protein
MRRQPLDRIWDHWVPGANKATEEIVRAWADKEKVDVKMDFITSQGNKNLLTIAAEAQAKSGHDIFAFPTWWPQQHADNLEPVNDLMTELVKQNGAVNGTVEYLGKAKGQMAGRAGDRRQPDQGSVLAHRPHEAACRN